MLLARTFAAVAAPPPQAVFSWTDALSSLIHPHNLDASATHSRAVPTNAWWGNWLAWDPPVSVSSSASTTTWTTSQPDSDPIFANPYTYRIVGGRGLGVSYLHPFRVDGPLDDHGAIRYYFYPATIRNLVLSATEWTQRGAVALRVHDWDDLGLSFTLAAHVPHNKPPTQFAKAYLAQGTAFTTVEYNHLHVELQSDHTILTVNGRNVADGGVVEDDTFVLTLNNGQKWVVLFFPAGGCRRGRGSEEDSCSGSSSESGSSTISLVVHPTKLVSSELFTGIVQVAYVSGGSPSNPKAHADAEDVATLAVYRRAAGVFATHARLFVEDDGEAFGFEWQLQSAHSLEPLSPEACPAQMYLHFALPHLQSMMDPAFAVEERDLVLYSHTRGPMRAYALRCNDQGKMQWRFVPPSDISAAVEAQATSFLPVHGSHLPKTLVEELKLVEVLHEEIVNRDWQAMIPNEGSYYFKGKVLQMLGSMCLVADQLARTSCPELASVAATGIRKFRAVLEKFVANEAAFPLVYDTVYKGIITSEALKRNDVNVDFGNAVYNDHHYHYGYTVMASAILLHLEKHGLLTDNSMTDAFHTRLAWFVDTLIRDVATPDANDPFFPRFRLFSWFLGHSYSHGVTPMADGKDQESTSEEGNFLYGLALYSEVTGNTRMAKLAKLMLKVNALAVRTYFLISDEHSGIHPPSFAIHRAMGIIFDNKCDYTTWFSPAAECIHGIQMIPVSPISDVVRTRTFVEKEWRELLQDLACVKEWQTHGSGWTSLLYSNAAVLDPKRSCEVLAKCPMDDGLSRAWALFMAATKRVAQ